MPAAFPGVVSSGGRDWHMEEAEVSYRGSIPRPGIPYPSTPLTMFISIPRPDFYGQPQRCFVMPGEPEASEPGARPASFDEFFSFVVVQGAWDCSEAAWQAYIAASH